MLCANITIRLNAVNRLLTNKQKKEILANCIVLSIDTTTDDSAKNKEHIHTETHTSHVHI